MPLSRPACRTFRGMIRGMLSPLLHASSQCTSAAAPCAGVPGLIYGPRPSEAQAPARIRRRVPHCLRELQASSLTHLCACQGPKLPIQFRKLAEKRLSGTAHSVEIQIYDGTVCLLSRWPERSLSWQFLPSSEIQSPHRPTCTKPFYDRAISGAQTGLLIRLLAWAFGRSCRFWLRTRRGRGSPPAHHPVLLRLERASIRIACLFDCVLALLRHILVATGSDRRGRPSHYHTI